ncbi:MAG: prolipoprotein diacylglyceryl transferase [Bacteroidetes bacterium]|nr:prolipoprotein diacylglyceryl transferase [Bacteroidota bacterium]
MLSYIIWNGSPEILSIGFFSLRYYGLLFALGFLISQQILYYIHKQEGKPEKDVDTLTIYMIVATIIGARLGHIIFYEPAMLWEKPLAVFLPFELSPFRFTGLQGLASHGAAIGILFGLWLYSRKKHVNQNYLQILDRIVILVCLTGCLIRLGNFFNSEIIGKPTNSPLGVIFVNHVIDRITAEVDGANPIQSYEIVKDSTSVVKENGRVPLSLYLFFKKGTSETAANEFVDWRVRNTMAQQSEFVDISNGAFAGKVGLEASGTYAAKVSFQGIARHPAQLYESISCLILFALLLWYWSKHKLSLPEGRIFGIFLIALWSLRFAYEFLKENQVSFEDDLTLNMGQTLSIPLVLVGVWVLIRSFKKQPDSPKI